MLTKAQENTKAILKRYEGLPGEYYMLKGLLCLCIVNQDDLNFDLSELIDTHLIAVRMDVINKEQS